MRLFKNNNNKSEIGGWGDEKDGGRREREGSEGIWSPTVFISLSPFPSPFHSFPIYSPSPFSLSLSVLPHFTISLLSFTHSLSTLHPLLLLLLSLSLSIFILLSFSLYPPPPLSLSLSLNFIFFKSRVKHKAESFLLSFQSLKLLQIWFY